MKILIKVIARGTICIAFFLAGALWQKHIEANKPFRERKHEAIIKKKEKKKEDSMDPSN